MSVQIIQGDALALPLDDATVDLICTSPPFFGLRSYQDDGAHYAGQLGSEATPAEFVDALIGATREMVRVLKPSGSIWVNLGDKYAGADVQPRQSANTTLSGGKHAGVGNLGPARRVDTSAFRAKSLIGIPWRYALRCIDDLGLILRAEVIWSKPNGLPESVTDRVRRSHEVFWHFTREPRYFSAVDELRETYSETFAANHKPGSRNGTKVDTVQAVNGTSPLAGVRQPPNPLGKLPGSVWTVPTQPLTVPAHLGVDHFAAFPMEWPRRIIRGWSPSGVCVVCGEGRRPVVSRPGGSWHDHEADGQGHNQDGRSRKQRYNERIANGQVASITGTECACGQERTAPPGSLVPSELSRKSAVSEPRLLPPTRPSTILDPFGGTGTTALVAHALGRHGVSVDMSGDYSRLAKWRTTDPAQLAAALQVDKPEPARQTESLFDLWDGAAS